MSNTYVRLKFFYLVIQQMKIYNEKRIFSPSMLKMLNGKLTQMYHKIKQNVHIRQEKSCLFLKVNRELRGGYEYKMWRVKI